MEIDFAERLGSEKLAKKGDFEVKTGVFGAKNG